jgi:hypothetical protein
LPRLTESPQWQEIENAITEKGQKRKDEEKKEEKKER